MTQIDEKAGCPFCGAKPHYNLGRLTSCQLHGEPQQDHVFKCPHGCASRSGPTKQAALENWNRRAALPPTGDVAGLREAIDDCEEARKQRDIRDRFLVQRGLWGEFCKWLPDELPPVSAEARIAELERELKARKNYMDEDYIRLYNVYCFTVNKLASAIARAERLEAALRGMENAFVLLSKAMQTSEIGIPLDVGLAIVEARDAARAALANTEPQG